VNLHQKTKLRPRDLDRSVAFRCSCKEHVQSLGRYPGRVTLIRAAIQPKGARLSYEDPTNGWGAIADGGVEVIHVPGTHWTIFDPPNLQHLANALRASLGGARATGQD
jgi:thioesterase domain-containing protein